MKKNTLFVCGCPRSGTTALGHLISSHEKVVLGVERYGAFCSPGNYGKLNRSLFEKERFFDVRSGDTHYTDMKTFHEFADYYDTAYSRYDDALYVGDKIPTLYNDFKGLSERLENPKVIFISRNIFDVCLSYNRRLNSETDSWDRTINHAVTDWNQSHDNYRKSVDVDFSGLALEYEDLYRTGTGSDETLQRIFDFLELDITDAVIGKYKELISKTNYFEKRRVSEGLSQLEKRYICKNAWFGAYKDVTAL